MPSKIAAQLYTVREFCKNAEDTAKSMKKIREIGYEAVQFSGVNCPADEFKKICDNEGLNIAATHVPGDRLENDLDKLIEEHKMMDCKYVGLGALGGDMRSAEGFAEAGKKFTEIGKKLKEHGLLFVYHNHAFEFQKYDGKFGFDILFENVDLEYVVPEIDTYWAHYGGMDVVQLINRFKGKLPFVHLKDLTIVDNEVRFAPVGDGNLNFPAYLEAFNKAGTEWMAVEQDQCYDIDPFEALKRSFDNLKKMGVE